MAPLDDALGLQPHQRTSGEFQSLGCALAVFVPFATAATLLGWASGVAVSPRAVWEWVQAAGQRAMEQLHAQLQAAAAGHLPPEEPLAAEVAAMPLALGADRGDGAVSSRGRPPQRQNGLARGQTGRSWPAWAAIAPGPARWLLDCISAGWWPSSGISRRSRGVCGSKPCVRHQVRALRWSGSVMAPGGCGALFEEYFTAYALGILDFYHAAQQLWKGATAWLD